MTELPETCDFCELSPSDDASLVEVRFGSLPQPNMIRLKGTDSQHRRESNRQAQGRLLVELMKDDPSFDVTLHNMVEEVTAVGGETHFAEKPSDISAGGWQSEYHDDKVGVRLSVYPDAVETEPDAMLCEGCADMLR